MIKDNTLVSILINCFNSEKYIEKCIDSCIDQSYSNIEIIIWDNCSTDNTYNIVNSYSDKRIKYFKSKKHTTLGEARIEAIKKIKGKFTAILDSDDLAEKNRIELQLHYFYKNKNLALCGGWMKIINHKGIMKNYYKPNYINKNLNESILWHNPIIHSSIMYKTNIARELKWYSSKLVNFQDYGLTLKISFKYEINILNQVIGSQRLHSKNTISNRALFMTQFKEYDLLLRYARFFANKNNKHLVRLNYYSFCVNTFKVKLFNLQNHITIKNILDLIHYILTHLFILKHNGIVRRFFKIY